MKTFRLIKDIYKASPGRIWLEGISMLTELLNSLVVQILLVKRILDKVVAGAFQEAIGLIVFAAAADLICSLFERWMIHYYRKKDDIRLHQHFHGKLYRCAVGADLRYYDNPDYYNQFILAAKNGDTRAVECLNTMKEGIVTVIQLLITGGLIVTNLDSLLWVVLLASTLYAVVSNREAKVRVALVTEQNPYEKKREYLKRLFFLKKYAVDLRNRKVSERLFSMFDSTHAEEIKAISPHTKKQVFLQMLSGILFYFQYVAMIVLLSYRALHTQDISVGDFSMLLSSALLLSNNWRFIGDLISNLSEHRMFADQYYRFLETAKEEKKDRRQVSQEIESIEAKNISFRYEEQGKQVFDEISLRIQKGEKVALVGPNGAGKSTFVNLLLNLYEPQSGSLTCNGEDICQYEPTAYRGCYSLIFQESNLYPCTVAENLLLGKLTKKEDEKRLWEVLDQVGLGDKIRKLPLKLSTPVTKEFEKDGVVFSGGECQRMALARAILQDSSVFVMDEPSSALDPDMELQLNMLFGEVLTEKTLLLISHRISTIAGMDYIYMINNGKIEEKGTHQELMEKDGHYARIYRIQSGLYQM